MNNGIEAGINNEEEISILEKRVGKTGTVSTQKDPLHKINPEPETKKTNYEDYLLEARLNIIENKTLYSKILEAIKNKIKRNPSDKFTEIENLLVEKCINLSDSDIDSVVRQLNRKFIEHIQSMQGSLDIDGNTLVNITTGKWNLNSGGIKSVVNFIKNRVQLLRSNPSQDFTLGVNERLDARFAIDLIEVIRNTSGDIDQLNLIQIKSSEPTEEEKEKIVKTHRDFVNQNLLSLKDVDEFSIPKEEERKIFEDTINDQSVMFDKLFDICIDYRETDLGSLSVLLGINHLTNLQRAWILSTYFEIIIEQIESAYREGYIEEESKSALIKDLTLLLEESVSKSGIPTNIIKINSVNSIIAVGPRVVSEISIYGSEESPLTASVSN